MERIHDPELLDRPGLEPLELERALAHVSDVNRWLGGDRALRRTLGPLLSEGREQRLLDVGSGNAQVALALARWAGAKGRLWRVVALDPHPLSAALANRRVARATTAGPSGTREVVPTDSASPAVAGRVTVVRGDGLALPFHDCAFDAAYTVLTLHHFEDDAATTLVREMARVARRSVVVNDLERSRPALLGARLLAATVWRGSPITRHDGPLSVRRAFTPAELLAIGKRAGLRRPRVRRHPAFRLVLEGSP